MVLSRTKLDAYCLSKPAATKDYPFDATTAVYRVMGKIFALSNEGWDAVAVNLKCDPDWALALRDIYAAVQPGYHMNKRHWNTVTIDETIPTNELLEMIDHSYDVVVKTLKKSDREVLNSIK